MRYLLWVFVLSTAHAQIQINELMIDPNPVVQLPDAEYIELFNNTDSSINLIDFAIADQTRRVHLPDTIIHSRTFILLVKEMDGSVFSSNAIGLSTWASLNNTSDEIRLYYNGVVIDSVLYESNWLQSSSGGGYSLERKTVNGYCSVIENWGVSVDQRGGTPGIQNSIFEEVVVLPKNRIIGVSVDSLVKLTFKVPLTVSSFSLYFNNQELDFEIDNTLNFSPNNQTGLCSIQIKNLEDCKNQFYDIDTSLVLGILPKIGDLLINEILFNPITGGDDFVEIINSTNSYLDLSKVELSNYDDGSLDEKKNLNLSFLRPHEIICFTKNRNHLLNQYPNSDTSTIIELKDLPTFRNDSGSVVLSIDNLILDKFTYKENMHHSLLEDLEGVSLERVNFNNLWHSAASSQNYGTPGYKNSQTIEGIDEFFQVSPKVFTPDFDGYKDFTVISYNLGKSGCVGNVGVYDLKGTKIKTLVGNSILDVEGEFIWDGSSDYGVRAKVGYYVVLFELDMPNEGLKKWKKTVVLGTRFN